MNAPTQPAAASAHEKPDFAEVGSDFADGAFFSRFLEWTLEAVVVIDEERIVREYNGAAHSFFGYPRDIVIGRRLSVLDRPMFARDGSIFEGRDERIASVFDTGRATTRTLVGFEDIDRGAQWMEFAVVPAVVADGKVTHVALMHHDVTDLVEAGVRIALHGQVIAQAADTIVVTDARGVVLEVNPAFVALTGFSAEEIVGGSLAVLERHDRVRPVFRRMMAALAEGLVWSDRITHRRRDGADIECIGTLSPLRGPEGKLNGFAYMLRNIGPVAEVERRALASQKMEAIGTLAGAIAHDFNNLLQSISGYAELALRDASPHSAAHLRNVLRGCERADGLVRNILTFSRREERARVPVDIRVELEKSIEFIRVTLPTGVVISSDIRCGDAMVLADSSDIRQVVINLLSNAWQSLPNRTGRISLAARRVEIGQTNRVGKNSRTFGPHVEIIVEDNGAGISPENIHRIFEPFFTTKRMDEGGGMGLAIVHGIVASLRGEIAVTSPPRQGTRFTILLPIARVGIAAAASDPKSEPDRGGEHILLVEDEYDVTPMFGETLSSLGYRVTACDGGEEALALIRSPYAGFDLVIMDLNISGDAGVRLAAQFRTLRPEIPVLLCADGADAELLRSAREADVAHILHKPLRPSTMSAVIRSALTSASLRFTPSPSPRIPRLPASIHPTPMMAPPESRQDF